MLPVALGWFWFVEAETSRRNFTRNPRVCSGLLLTYCSQQGGSCGLSDRGFRIWSTVRPSPQRLLRVIALHSSNHRGHYPSNNPSSSPHSNQ
ncbi:hypothetical protein F4679DRAFT_232214 [Xylaria curta]|nr:hypothetical protein F4679DRAFT_232214 [Xylaria curta]